MVSAINMTTSIDREHLEDAVPSVFSSTMLLSARKSLYTVHVEEASFMLHLLKVGVNYLNYLGFFHMRESSALSLIIYLCKYIFIY